MIALLDANILIALFDAAHLHHMKAHQWLEENRNKGWATCPLTQNACIRIISQPAYPGRLSISDIARRLHQSTSAPDHHFWPDSVALCDPTVFAHEQILSPRYLTDLYLLGLAVKNKGKLITFDRNIPIASVPAATDGDLEVL